MIGPFDDMFGNTPFDLDHDGFYLQMYGTAVKVLNEQDKADKKKQELYNQLKQNQLEKERQAEALVSSSQG